MPPPRFSVFFGDASAAEARVYVRCDVTDVALGGTVRGPESVYARTLPATVPLRDLGEGLAEGVLPDPCFWTPEMPHRYQVEVVARRGDAEVGRHAGELGIRPLAARGQNLVLDARRWVLRGVAREAAALGPEPLQVLPTWHETSTTLVTSDPDDALCREASRLGVLIVARVTAAAGDVAAELARLASWPAVGIAALTTMQANDGLPRHRPPNLLLAEWAAPAAELLRPAAWADLIVCEDEPSRLAERAADCALPLIACRPTNTTESVAEARAACDHLQRDLAAYGQYAGYIV